MKYQESIIINAPKEQVAEYLHPKYAFEWMEGLQQYELTTGEWDEEGAVAEMRFKTGKREMNMTETLIDNQMPDEKTMTYDAKNVHNIVRNILETVDGNKTKYINDQEFQFSGFFMKAMGFLLPGLFKKQSRKYLKDFKAFVETEVQKNTVR